MTLAPVQRYVALGDSLTEGLGDERFDRDRQHAGWADRLAAVIHDSQSERNVALSYANLAVRSRRLEHILTSQVEHALDLKPDFVTVMAGANDLWKPVADWSRLRDLYAQGITRLREAGATVMVANSINPVHAWAFRPGLRRAALMTEMVETVARELGCVVLDVYRLEPLYDVKLWARDRVHFGATAHTHVANRAAEALGLARRMILPQNGPLHSERETVLDCLQWISHDVTPFFLRVLRGVTAGDGIVAKRPHLEHVHDHPWSTVGEVGVPRGSSFVGTGAY